MRGVRGRESWNKSVTWPKLLRFVLTLHYGMCNSRTIQKKNVFRVLALKSASRCEQNISVFPHRYLHSCRGEGGGWIRKVLTFCLEGGVILVYLSGVNFQALSSFWACSSLSLVCSSSAFILWKNKLMAGSTMDDLSWAALGCWTCFRYWIWVCRMRKTIRTQTFEPSVNEDKRLYKLAKLALKLEYYRTVG